MPSGESTFKLAFLSVNSIPHVSCFFFFFFFWGGGGGGGGGGGVGGGEILLLCELQCLVKLFSVNNELYAFREQFL